MPEEFEPGQLFRLKAHFSHGCVKGAVYQIERADGERIFAYRLGKGYKNVRKGNIRGNTFGARFDSFRDLIEKDAISFVKLEEVTKKEEYKSVVRRPKTQTGVSTNIAIPTDKAYTITPDVHTQDNTPLWVVKFTERMERAEFIAVSDRIKGLGGYYSRFKRGFVFKSDPTEALKDFRAAA
jgi:hypothetical protein